MVKILNFSNCKWMIVLSKESLLPLEGKRPSSMLEDDCNVLDMKTLQVVKLTIARSVTFK